MNKRNEKLAKKYLQINVDTLLGSSFPKKEEFKLLCDKLIVDVDAIPLGKVLTDNGNADGACIINHEDVEGYDSFTIRFQKSSLIQSKNDKRWVTHEGIHEFCHACCNILNLVYNDNKEGIIVGDEKRENVNGLIKTTDKKTGEFISQHFYFKMFNETMMDIATLVGIEHNISNQDRIGDVLAGELSNNQSWYYFFIPLTSLYISAFSNNPNPDYLNAINNGTGLVFDETITSTGKKLNTNDFIHGSFCDPLFIDKLFDKYTKDGAFSDISKKMDVYYIRHVNNYDKDFVKYNINMLVDFINNKLADYKAKKIFSDTEASSIMENFNNQLNKTVSFYNIVFKDYEIEELEAKGIKFPPKLVGSSGTIKTKRYY